MATKAEAKQEVKDPNVIMEYEYDPAKVYENPWDVTVKGVVIPRGVAGSDPYMYIGVNGVNYQVPRGKPVDIPLPLYDRWLIAKRADDAEAEYRASIRKEVTTELKRV